MNALAAHCTVVDLNMIGNLQDGEHFVAVTFDDGLDSFVRNAVPVLSELKIPATVFVVANALGKRPVWGEGYFTADERVMSEDDLNALPPEITIGSHTLTHADLISTDPERASREVTESRRVLESMLHRRVSLFSFPFGNFNADVLQYCHEAGYDRVFTTEPETIAGDSSAFVLGRVAADPWDWTLEFLLKILGAYRWTILLRGIGEFFCPYQPPSSLRNGLINADVDAPPHQTAGCARNRRSTKKSRGAESSAQQGSVSSNRHSSD
jgi:peptidoglycan/xylan/chitin deacetylase (PgdA/CDA1 family)